MRQSFSPTIISLRYARSRLWLGCCFAILFPHPFNLIAQVSWDEDIYNQLVAIQAQIDAADNSNVVGLNQVKTEVYNSRIALESGNAVRVQIRNDQNAWGEAHDDKLEAIYANGNSANSYLYDIERNTDSVETELNTSNINLGEVNMRLGSLQDKADEAQETRGSILEQLEDMAQTYIGTNVVHSEQEPDPSSGGDFDLYDDAEIVGNQEGYNDATDEVKNGFFDLLLDRDLTLPTIVPRSTFIFKFGEWFPGRGLQNHLVNFDVYPAIVSLASILRAASYALLTVTFAVAGVKIIRSSVA